MNLGVIINCFQFLFIINVGTQKIYSELLGQNRIKNISRHHDGDEFTVSDEFECNTDICFGISSGTAERIETNHITNQNHKCNCKCVNSLRTFREDFGICVDDIKECSSLYFRDKSMAEKIPFVFLPLQGQIVYPSKAIYFEGATDTICAVSSSQYLTQSGWIILKNKFDGDVPFRLYHENDKTFLQWLGDDDSRAKMQGRLVLVHLSCRSIKNNSSLTKAEELEDKSSKTNISTASFCISFRVFGTPSFKKLGSLDVKLRNGPSKFSFREYFTITFCSLCLGFIYVFIFIYVKFKKKETQSDSNVGEFPISNKNELLEMVESHDGINDICTNKQENSDVFFKMHLSESVSVESGKIKLNPLLQSGMNTNFLPFYDQNEKLPNKLIDEIQQYDVNDDVNVGHKDNTKVDQQIQSKDQIGLNTDELINFQIRRKLYFNPAYFEPNLLISPPPSALEFLQKIREVIDLAKQKMSAKRYRPSLEIILEEENSELGKRENQNQIYHTLVKKFCQGCPGCTSKSDINCKNNSCECVTSLQNNVTEWLKNVNYNDNILQQNHIKINEMISESKETDEKQLIYNELINLCRIKKIYGDQTYLHNTDIEPYAYEPAPDYNSYNRKLAQSIKQYQPDSPIYSRKSPSYLIVDYETDSLERMIENKMKEQCSSPSKFYSEISSQPSPSLSGAALPLEEEVEVCNALYNQFEGVRRENNRKFIEKGLRSIDDSDLKIKYDTPMLGSMTIELEYDLNDYENLSNNSDQYEPDTLDRKKTEKHVYGEINKGFDLVHSETEKGRLLTLEYRHSKRQRMTGYASLDKKLVPSNNLNDENIMKFLDTIKEENALPHQSIINGSSQPQPKLKSIRGSHLIIHNDNKKKELIQDNNHFHSTIQAYNVELFSNQNLKKSKDFKNAWKKFVDIASKFAEKGECFDKVNNENIIMTSNSTKDEDDKRLAKQIDCDVEKGKVKNIIKQLNGGDCNKLRENDSGYISAESTDSKYKFVESSSTTPNSENNCAEASTNEKECTDENFHHDKNGNFSSSFDTAPDSGIYRIDLEKISSNSESDGEFNYDDVCESGAESVETSSVLYKIIRKD